MAEVGEAILKAFDVGFLLWGGRFHVLPGLPATQLKYLHDDLTCPFQQPHSAWALPRSIHTALRGQVAGEPVQPLVVISKPPPWVWTHSLGMSRKENALDLAKFVDKGVRVKLSGGREGTQHIIAWTLSNN